MSMLIIILCVVLGVQAHRSLVRPVLCAVGVLS